MLGNLRCRPFMNTDVRSLRGGVSGVAYTPQAPTVRGQDKSEAAPRFNWPATQEPPKLWGSPILCLLYALSPRHVLVLQHAV